MIRRFAVVLVAAFIASLAGFGDLSPARADTIGGIAWLPNKGTSETLITVQTSAPCDTPAQRVSAVLFGKGLPPEGEVVFSPSRIDFSYTERLVLPLNNAFVIYAENNNTILQGKYTLKVRCIDRLGATVIDDFVGTMTWNTPGGSIKNIDKATFVATNTAKLDPDLVGVGAPRGAGEVQSPDAAVPTAQAPGTSPGSAPATARPDAAAPKPEESPATTPQPQGTPSAQASGVETPRSPALIWFGVAAIVAAAIAGTAIWLRRRRSQTT